MTLSELVASFDAWLDEQHDHAGNVEVSDAQRGDQAWPWSRARFSAFSEVRAQWARLKAGALDARRAPDDAPALAPAHPERTRDVLLELARWIKQPGNINRDDAIDEIARLLTNNAVAVMLPQDYTSVFRQGDDGMHE